jgi:hypothetical protein
MTLKNLICIIIFMSKDFYTSLNFFGQIVPEKRIGNIFSKDTCKNGFPSYGPTIPLRTMIFTNFVLRYVWKYLCKCELSGPAVLKKEHFKIMVSIIVASSYLISGSMILINLILNYVRKLPCIFEHFKLNFSQIFINDISICITGFQIVAMVFIYLILYCVRKLLCKFELSGPISWGRSLRFLPISTCENGFYYCGPAVVSKEILILFIYQQM